jgi:organic radical activating enzyme
MAARADEIKLIVDGRVPLEWLDAFPRSEIAVFLQPEGNKPANVALALAAAKAAPARLRLSLQTHKFIGIP